MSKIESITVRERELGFSWRIVCKPLPEGIRKGLRENDPDAIRSLALLTESVGRMECFEGGPIVAMDSGTLTVICDTTRFDNFSDKDRRQIDQLIQEHFFASTT